MAVHGALWTALNGGTPLHTIEAVADCIPAVLLGLESVGRHERTYRELERIGAPTPGDGYKATHTLIGGPCDGYRVYVSPDVSEVSVYSEDSEVQEKHRYIRHVGVRYRFRHVGGNR